MQHQKRSSLHTYLLAASLVVLAVQTFLAQPQNTLIDYSDFKALVRSGAVSEVQIADRLITGQADIAGQRTGLPDSVRDTMSARSESAHSASFETVRIEDAALLEDLESAHIRYSAAASHDGMMTLLSWVVPALIFVGIWSFALPRIAGRGAGDFIGVGKSKPRYSFGRTSM